MGLVLQDLATPTKGITWNIAPEGYRIPKIPNDSRPYF
jgi:hypothetical protein